MHSHMPNKNLVAIIKYLIDSILTKYLVSCTKFDFNKQILFFSVSIETNPMITPLFVLSLSSLCFVTYEISYCNSNFYYHRRSSEQDARRAACKHSVCSVSSTGRC